MLRNTGNSERKQRGQVDVCFIQQLIIEPITYSLDPDTTHFKILLNIHDFFLTKKERLF